MREKQEKRGNEGTNGSGKWEEGVEMRVRGDGRVEGGGWRGRQGVACRRRVLIRNLSLAAM